QSLAHPEPRKNEDNPEGQLRHSESSLGDALVFSVHRRTRREARFAGNQDKADKSAGRVLKDLRGAFLEQLAVIDGRFGLCKVFRWLQDETRRNALMRELNLLNEDRKS